MNKAESFIATLKAGLIGLSFQWAKVKEIDEKKNTITATSLADGLDFFNIMLSLSSENISIPKLESRVLLGMFNKTDGFILFCEEIEKQKSKVGECSYLIEKDEITINEGKNGSLIKVGELQKELKKNNDILQVLLDTVQQPINEPGNGSPSVFATNLNLALKGKSLGKFDENIENEKIKH